MPTIVDSTQCHLWTDALHARQLAREALNKWDRGTYVRMCVTTSWTALEVACQDALSCTDISYRFKENLDRAIAAASLPSLDWSTGTWDVVGNNSPFCTKELGCTARRKTRRLAG